MGLIEASKQASKQASKEVEKKFPFSITTTYTKAIKLSNSS
jgi:L-lysine 2,3-aminomutase